VCFVDDFMLNDTLPSSPDAAKDFSRVPVPIVAVNVYDTRH
jgi:hypothetical protein